MSKSTPAEACSIESIDAILGHAQSTGAPVSFLAKGKEMVAMTAETLAISLPANPQTRMMSGPAAVRRISGRNKSCPDPLVPATRRVRRLLSSLSRCLSEIISSRPCAPVSL